MRFGYPGISVAIAFVSFLTCMAKADSIVVNASDVIYAAGSQSADVVGTGGTVPGFILLPAGTTLIGSAA